MQPAFIILICHKYLCCVCRYREKDSRNSIDRVGKSSRRKWAGWCLIRLSLRRWREMTERGVRCFRRVSPPPTRPVNHQLITCSNMQQRLVIIYSAQICVAAFNRSKAIEANKPTTLTRSLYWHCWIFDDLSTAELTFKPCVCNDTQTQ